MSDEPKPQADEAPPPVQGDTGQNEDDVEIAISMLPRPRKQRLTASVLLGAPFPNPDSGTEFDDKFFVSLERSAGLDLPPQFLQKAQRLAVFLWRKNARAYCATELVTDFILGDGIRFNAEDPKVQELLERHWELNEWDDKMQERIRTMGLFGEALFPVFVSDKGMVRVSTISPFKIIKLKRDSEDAETLTDVLTSMPDGDKRDEEKPDQPKGKVYKLVRIQDDGTLLDDPGKTSGLAFYFAVNRLSGGARGSPDMLSSIDWLEGLDSFLFSVMERAEITQELVWNLEYTGAKPDEIRTKVKDFTRSLRSGGVIGHNENMKVEVVVPQLAASDADKVSSLLLRQIQAGMRLAGLFFGDSEDLTRASANELSMPVAKMIQSRQNFWRRLLSRIFKFQIQQAKKANIIPAEASEVFEIDMAQVFLRDLSAVTSALVPLTAALDIAIEKKWVTMDESRVVFRTVLEQITRLPDIKDVGRFLQEVLPPELQRNVQALAATWQAIQAKLENGNDSPDPTQEGTPDDGAAVPAGADAVAG